MSTITNSGSTTQEYKLPKGPIKLSYSSHAMDRLKERTTGSLILAPQYIRFTKGNTTDIKIQNGKVKEATIFLEYKKGILMFLPIIVGSGIVKTVFFKYVKKKSFKKIGISQKDEPLEKVFEAEISGTEGSREEGPRENVVYVFGNMGGKKSRWQELFRAIRRLFRKGT